MLLKLRYPCNYYFPDTLLFWLVQSTVWQHTLRPDLTKPIEIEAMIASTLDAFGRLDMLHNNASACHPRCSNAAWRASPNSTRRDYTL